METNKQCLAKRILWKWLRVALVLEATLSALMAYLGFRRGTPFYLDAETLESFAFYAIAIVGAAGVIAVAEILAGDDG